MRVMENGRLAWYRDDADETFWGRHWVETFNPEVFDLADKGWLGEMEGVFTRWLPRDGLILDAGCGYGARVVALTMRGWNVDGVDNAPEAVDLARQHRPAAAVQLGDVTRLGVPDGHYAGYVSLGVVEHSKEGPGPFLSEALRVLRPGGVAVISVPHFNLLRRIKARLKQFAKGPGKGRFYQYAFTRSEFVLILERAGFRILQIQSVSPIKGAKDEIGWIAGLLAIPRIGGYFNHALVILFQRLPFLRESAGHMLVVVARKPDA